jgi:hypothetical protein
MSAIQTAAIVLAAASATAVCASQTPGGAGALTINGGSASGGVATLDVARRVLWTTAGNESGKQGFLTGTDRYGNPIREVLSLPNAGTVQSLQDFKTVTGVFISAAAAGAMTVGTSGVASTKWFKLDVNRHVFNASAAVNFGGVTASVTVEACIDPFDKQQVDEAPGGSGDASAAGLATSTYVAPYAFTVTAGITSDQIVNATAPVAAIRLTVNSGAASAGVRISVVQQGV